MPLGVLRIPFDIRSFKKNVDKLLCSEKSDCRGMSFFAMGRKREKGVDFVDRMIYASIAVL